MGVVGRLVALCGGWVEGWGEKNFVRLCNILANRPFCGVIMKRNVIILVSLLLCAVVHGVQAQGVASSPFGVQMGASVMSGFGQRQALQWVAPHATLVSTSRLTVQGGFAAVGSLLPQGMLQNAKPADDLTPLRDETKMAAGWLRASWQATDRLLLWGAVARLGGQLTPLWSNQAMPLGVTVVSGGARYALTESSSIEMSFHYVRDDYGSLWPAMFAMPHVGFGNPGWPAHVGGYQPFGYYYY